jgi:hypothetical protein
MAIFVHTLILVPTGMTTYAWRCHLIVEHNAVHTVDYMNELRLPRIVDARAIQGSMSAVNDVADGWRLRWTATVCRWWADARCESVGHACSRQDVRSQGLAIHGWCTGNPPGDNLALHR